MQPAPCPALRAAYLVGGVLLSLLAACGGGSDEPAAPSDASATAPLLAPSVATAPPAAPAVSAPAQAPAASTTPLSPASPVGPSTTAADCGIVAFSNTALARINQYRAAGASCGARGAFAPAAAVRWADALAQAAAAHSLDMATQDYFSHTSLDGRSMADRINATGYAWRSLGENIAAGQVGIDAVVDAWMRSDGHCANLLNPAFDHIGLACVSGAAGSRYRTYWTLNLARAR